MKTIITVELEDIDFGWDGITRPLGVCFPRAVPRVHIRPVIELADLVIYHGGIIKDKLSLCPLSHFLRWWLK